MCIHSDQELLKNGRCPGIGRLKGCKPALARRLSGAKTLKRQQVAIGKRDVQLFHPRAVVKKTGGDAFLNFDRNVPVERGEVSEPAFVPDARAGLFDPVQRGLRQ